MIETTDTERRIAERIDRTSANQLTVSNAAGGLAVANMGQALEVAKIMAISSIAVPKHLRGNPGACLAVVIQAIEWRMSPYAVANKSYSVNDRLSYESQLVQAVILQRAPITGRFKYEFSGDGDTRKCRVSAKTADGETVEYVSPLFGRITPKNSPLWKTDPDHQLGYFSARALCRRHFPDVLLGVYTKDEAEDSPPEPEKARDVTPPRSLSERLDALAVMPQEPDLPEPEPPPPPAPPSDAAAEDRAAPDDVSPSGAAPEPELDEPEPEPQFVPHDSEEYTAYFRSWMHGTDDPSAAEARWREERPLRQKCKVSSRWQAELYAELQEHLAEITDNQSMGDE